MIFAFQDYRKCIFTLAYRSFNLSSKMKNLKEQMLFQIFGPSVEIRLHFVPPDKIMIRLCHAVGGSTHPCCI